MKPFLLFLMASLCLTATQAQAPDSAAMAAKNDSLKMVALFSKASYPLIKSSRYSGVLSVENITETPDLKNEYKLLIDFVTGPTKANASTESESLEEIGRIINLHIAAGIRKDRLRVVVVTHGPALFAVSTEEAYRKKFAVSNPNLVLLKELMDNGVRFIACGQAMNFFDVSAGDLNPGIRIALSAKTTFSSYENKGYLLFRATN